LISLLEPSSPDLKSSETPEAPSALFYVIASSPGYMPPKAATLLESRTVPCS